MHRQVALSDGVGTVRLVLVDQLMHVRTKDVLGVLVHILFVSLLSQDGRSTSRAAASRAANANARVQLKARDDGHRKAPAADGLAAQPCPEKTSETCVHERDDTENAGQALDAREASSRNSSCRSRRLRTRGVALGGLRSSGSSSSCSCARAAAGDNPVQDNDAAHDTAHSGISRMRRAAANYRHADGRCDSGQRCFRNPGQRASNVLGGASEAAPYLAWCRSSSVSGLASYWHFRSSEVAERCGHGTDKDERTSKSCARHVKQNELPERPL